jgi:hypothetical protein
VALFGCSDEPTILAREPAAQTVPFHDERVDFGSVVEGEILKHSFVLPNTTDGPLVVTAIESDCACTASAPVLRSYSGAEAYVLAAPIPAGTTLSVDVAFDTIRKRGPSTATLTVRIEGVEAPLRFVLAADVTPHVEIQPLPLDLGLLTTTQARSGETLITSPAGGRFRVSLSEADLPTELHAALAPVTGEDEFSPAWKLSVTLGPDAPKFDNHFYQVPLDCRWPPDCPLDQTLVERLPQTVSASIVAAVSGELAARPPYLSFGKVATGQATTRTLELVAPAASSLELDAADLVVVECEGMPAERVQLALARKSPSTFELAATVAHGPAHSRTFRGKIRIEGHEDLELLFFGLLE